MKKYFGYVMVADEEDKQNTINVLKACGATMQRRGLLKYILKKLAFIDGVGPLYRKIAYDVVVFHCPTADMVNECIKEDIMENGGYRVQ